MKEAATIFVGAFLATFLALGAIKVAADGIPPPAEEQTAPGQKYHLKPEVRIEIRQLDRIELYAGGLHVGTVIFDAYGHAIIVGDPDPVNGVIGELLEFLQWLRDAARGAELSGGNQQL